MRFEELKDGQTYEATATDGKTYKGTYTANYGGVFFCIYPAYLPDGKTENRLIDFKEV